MTTGTNHVRWFVEEVHPHGGQLESYVRGAFPTITDVDDVMQEAYMRVWKARATHPIDSAKAFLFTVARRVALDLVRRARRSPVDSSVDLAGLNVLDDRPAVSDRLNAQEKIDLLGEAIGSLPPRCREIVVLHKIKGHSQREVATHLGLSEKTVENQVALGVKRCERFFRSRGIEYFLR